MRDCPDCEKPIHGGSCHRCGWTLNPKATAPAPETQRPWTPPTYPAPAPGDDELIRAERAKLHAAAWWRDTRGTAHRPAVDPALRAECDRRNAAGPEPVGALLPPALRRRRP